MSVNNIASHMYMYVGSPHAGEPGSVGDEGMVLWYTATKGSECLIVKRARELIIHTRYGVEMTI